MAEISKFIIIAGTIFLVLIMAIIIIKSRYRKFTNREFVLSFRNGKIRSEGYGGAYFVLPLIDELIVLSTTVQQLDVDVSTLITKENQDVKVNCLVVWRIENPRSAYSSIAGSQRKMNPVAEINKVLSNLVESIVRTTTAKLTLDQVLRERGMIIDAIMSELVSVVGPMGIKINTAEIRHVEVVDQDLFNDLQEIYRQHARLDAQKTLIETNKEILKSEAYSEQQVRLYKAEQEELSNVRELEKDRKILAERRKLNEAEQARLQSVQTLEKNRETAVAEINQKKLRVQAETRLMQIELEAESVKRKSILEEIEVEAQSKKILAEAEAESIRLRAQARMEAVEMDARAEAFRLEKVADAKKLSMLAEADGRKAILLAEAEGLREKVQAQGLINEAMIMQELVQQLPKIASAIKVGDVNWLNMGGAKGDTPLGIIPKNILQLMALSKSFGLDVDKLLSKIRGKEKASNADKKLVDLIPANMDIEMLMNANPVMENEMVVGLDFDGDGEVDFAIPEKMRATSLDKVIQNLKELL